MQINSPKTGDAAESEEAMPITDAGVVFFYKSHTKADGNKTGLTFPSGIWHLLSWGAYQAKDDVRTLSIRTSKIQAYNFR